MSGEEMRVVVVTLLAVCVVLWVVVALMFKVSGIWERVSDDPDEATALRNERVELAQLGPFVTGRRATRGGHQEFSGLVVGPYLTLWRRDHGVPQLESMGFPEAIAAKLDGQVMARLKLRVVDGIELRGTFEPHKVEFTHQPPRVTKMYFLPGQPRRYRRVKEMRSRTREKLNAQVEPTA